jgi:hypothetical protein
MKLRILHISPYYLPDVAFGGPVFSVSALCEALAAKGAEVTVFTIGYFPGNQIYPKTELLNGVKVKYFKGDWENPARFPGNFGRHSKKRLQPLMSFTCTPGGIFLFLKAYE